MNRFPVSVHRYIYIFGLGLCAFALPLSKFLISTSLIVMLLNWIIEEPMHNRWERIKSNTLLWCFLSIYMIHIAGLVNTSNFPYALIDLNLKLPFLIIPVVISTSKVLHLKEIKQIVILFIIGVLLSTLYSATKIYLAEGDILTQMREISPFIWHIRLATMTVTAIAFIPWVYVKTENYHIKFLLIVFILWFIFFVIILQSLTGIILLMALLLYAFVYVLIKSKTILVKWMILTAGLTYLLITSSYLLKIYTHNFSPKPINYSLLTKLTSSGNPYQHDTITPWLENGNYVTLYICEKELKKEWELRSNYDLDSIDKNRNLIRATLIRYLTSKGLTKDSAGIAQLSNSDIVHIENSIPNPLYLNKMMIKPRIYRFMWELYHYYHGANPTGYSAPQRIEFFKTAYRAIKRNFWFGTGTGDVEDELLKQYEIDHSPLITERRARAHNQYLTFFLTFGFFGFIIIMSVFFLLPIFFGKHKNYLFHVFMLIFFFSMLSNNTLEKQPDILIVALFYSLFLFSDFQLNDTLPEKNPD